MARLTFKKFISELNQFVSGPQVVMPPKKIKDPKDPKKWIDNPKRKEYEEEELPSFGGPNDQVQLPDVKPEETKHVESEKVVGSGGIGKVGTLSRLGANTSGRSDMISRFRKGRSVPESPYFVVPSHLGSGSQVINPAGRR